MSTTSADSTPPTRPNPAEVVAKIEAMLAGNASDGVKSYTISSPGGVGQRTLERYSVTELLQLLEYWKRQAAKVANPTRLGGRRIACAL